MKFGLPFRRPTRSDGDRAASPVGSKDEARSAWIDVDRASAEDQGRPGQTLGSGRPEDAAAAARAADDLYFRMLCLAFVAMSG